MARARRVKNSRKQTVRRGRRSGAARRGQVEAKGAAEAKPVRARKPAAAPKAARRKAASIARGRPMTPEGIQRLRNALKTQKKKLKELRAKSTARTRKDNKIKAALRETVKNLKAREQSLRQEQAQTERLEQAIEAMEVRKQAAIDKFVERLDAKQNRELEKLAERLVAGPQRRRRRRRKARKPAE